MVNHVTRLAGSHHSPLHIFQEAAARAYLRVRHGSGTANSSNVGPSTNAPLRKSIDPINCPRCVSSRMARVLRFSEHSPGILNLLPLCEPLAICRCDDVDSCAITRHGPRRNPLPFFPSLIGFLHSPLKGASRGVRPLVRTANESGRRAVVQHRPRSPAMPRIQLPRILE